jgi:hypothetical protein
MRLGETELARKMLLATQPLGGIYSGPESERVDKANWFHIAVASWLSGIFHQAVEAHAAGDDPLTIDISQLLQTARPLLESAWTGMERPANLTEKSPLDFLDPVPMLRADSERRLKQAPRAPLDAQTIKHMPRTERIRELIDWKMSTSSNSVNREGSGSWDRQSANCSPRKMLSPSIRCWMHSITTRG